MRRYFIFVASLFLMGTAIAQVVSPNEQKFPDVIAVDIRASGKDRYDFDVTISSPYDTESRYADGFRIVSADGVILGERKLWHDHASEQPFTRDLYGVKLAAGVKTVIVQARDKKYGYGGKKVTVKVPER